MTSVTLPARLPASGRLRPLNVLRDLPRVADLIELCFADSMDSEGRSYIRQMRQASRDASFMRWASNAIEGASMPLSGFVWEQAGRIIGNVSLVPFRRKGRRVYLMANIATHPDHRRQGIARALTEEAMGHSRRRGASELWLHVRDSNPGAVKMYADLGFEERRRRTTWRVDKPSPTPSIPDLPPATKRLARYWPQQLSWLNQIHPEELAWYHSWNWNNIKPGLWNWLYRIFVEFDVRQWAVEKDGRLQAVITWLSSSRGIPLWLACGPGADTDSIAALLLQARYDLGYRRTLRLEHPHGMQNEAFQAAGFIPTRTLIWMKASGATP